MNLLENNIKHTQFHIQFQNSIKYKNRQEYIISCRMIIHKPLICKDGPCTAKLNEILKKIGADRQVYHAGSFNGNHANKCLQVRKRK